MAYGLPYVCRAGFIQKCPLQLLLLTVLKTASADASTLVEINVKENGGCRSFQLGAFYSTFSFFGRFNFPNQPCQRSGRGKGIKLNFVPRFVLLARSVQRICAT